MRRGGTRDRGGARAALHDRLSAGSASGFAGGLSWCEPSRRVQDGAQRVRQRPEQQSGPICSVLERFTGGDFAFT